MAGRKGSGIMADSLLDGVKAEVVQKFPESANVAQTVAVAAIKYRMLAYNTYSDITFDFDQALNLLGESGPYLLYTYARAKSVMRKAEESHTPESGIRNQESGKMNDSKQRNHNSLFMIHDSQNYNNNLND